MAKIGLFYGSTTGKTQSVAELIQELFGGNSVVELYDIADVEGGDFAGYENIIIACPTWDIGELQADWDGYYNDELDGVSFSGKKVAYFATGDQVGYPENFQDAMGTLEAKISELGGKTIGHWSTDGYEFEESKAVKNGKFVGLALDEDNQSDLTEKRVKQWVAQIRNEFGV